jgi:menaquinone-dependent protoporphyrinogen oxidase
MKVLVAVASKHAGTAEIAARISAVLTDHGHEVRVEDAHALRTVEDADAVILGSGVYYGHWLPEAVQLVDRLEAALRTRPVWLFSSGPSGDPPRPEASASVQVGDLVERTGARSHQVFSGRIDRHQLGLGEKVIVRAVRAPEGDFRDWVEVEHWAGAVADELDLVTQGVTGPR